MYICLLFCCGHFVCLCVCMCLVCRSMCLPAEHWQPPLLPPPPPPPPPFLFQPADALIEKGVGFSRSERVCVCAPIFTLCSAVFLSLKLPWAVSTVRVWICLCWCELFSHFPFLARSFLTQTCSLKKNALRGRKRGSFNKFAAPRCAKSRRLFVAVCLLPPSPSQARGGFPAVISNKPDDIIEL